jgi:hypothetical protein
MNIFLNTNNTNEPRRGVHDTHESKLASRHIVPPHERKAMMHIEFDNSDWLLLKEVFGDEDTTAAAVDIISNAPPEIQILAIQLINIIKEVV